MNSEVSSRKIATILSNFGIFLVSVNGPFTTQLIKKQRSSTLPLPSHANLHGILARKESMTIFSTIRRCFSKF